MKGDHIFDLLRTDSLILSNLWATFPQAFKRLYRLEECNSPAMSIAKLGRIA